MGVTHFQRGVSVSELDLSKAFDHDQLSDAAVTSPLELSTLLLVLCVARWLQLRSLKIRGSVAHRSTPPRGRFRTAPRHGGLLSGRFPPPVLVESVDIPVLLQDPFEDDHCLS